MSESAPTDPLQPQPDTQAPPPHAPGTDSAAATAAEKAVSSISVFSTRRPQHFGAGLASGLKNMARGVAAGAVSLVALPAMGYKNDGLVGVAKGIPMGLLSCVALSTAGAATGAVQIVRGALNTPEAVRESSANEKMWHADKREWVEVRLPAMLQDIPSDDSDIVMAARARKRATAASTIDDPSTNAPASSTELSYYEVLEISRQATPSEVKRAYAKMALKHHPDKNVGDPGAGERFQRVGEAYRVLSNEVSRAEYDRTGKREAEDSSDRRPFVPGLQLHPIQELLGGEALFPYIGHLYLGTTFFNDQFSFTPDEALAFQHRRCVRIAAHLARLLSDFELLGRTEGPEALREIFARRTAELLAGNHGADIAAVLAARMGLIASRYKSAANGSFIGRGVAAVEEWKQSAVSMGTTASTAFSTLKAMHQHKQLTNDEAIPMLLRLAAADITATVDVACDMVLYDLSVSRDERWERASNLLRFADFINSRLQAVRSTSAPNTIEN